MAYNLNKGISYKFLEFKSHDRSAYITEQDNSLKKAYFTSCLSNIATHWNLYINNLTKITAQRHMANSYFRFTNDYRGYLYLSVLIYTLNNLETEDLEAEFSKNSKII